MNNGDPSRLESEVNLTQDRVVPYQIEDAYDKLMKSYECNYKDNISTRVRQRYEQFLDNSKRLELFESMSRIKIFKSLADKFSVNTKVSVVSRILEDELEFSYPMFNNDDYFHIARAYVGEFNNVEDLFDKTLYIRYVDSNFKYYNEKQMEKCSKEHFVSKIYEYNPDMTPEYVEAQPSYYTAEVQDNN